MTITPTSIPQAEPAHNELDGVIFPPGDLYSDEPPLESDLHRDQINLLIRLLRWLWKERQDFYVSGNTTVYYSPDQVKSRDFRGPDFFVVLGAENRPRKSWVVWQEGGVYPHVIIELLSNSTAKVDRGLKKALYQNTFRTPDYFWFDPDSLEFEGFHLVDNAYETIHPNEQGQRWSQQLQLFLGIHNSQLRFFTSNGELVPTSEETSEAERQRAEAAQQQAEAEQQRAEIERQEKETERQHKERLAAKLRELGINPDEV